MMRRVEGTMSTEITKLRNKCVTSARVGFCELMEFDRYTLHFVYPKKSFWRLGVMMPDISSIN